jgi:hypothetical protein
LTQLKGADILHIRAAGPEDGSYSKAKSRNRDGGARGTTGIGNGRAWNWVYQLAMAAEREEPTPSSATSSVVRGREAELLLGALARVKARRFGRLIVTVNDGRVVDVEVVEKIDRDVLRAVSM